MTSIPDSSEFCYRLGINDITHRQMLHEAAQSRKRMEGLAELAGAIACELNDPISIVQGRLELLELGVSPSSFSRHVHVALEHANRISATLRNLRLVGRAATPNLKQVFLEEIFDEAFDLIGPRAKKAYIKTHVEPDDLAVGGDQAMYARVVADLLRRALDTGASQLFIRGRRTRDAVSLIVTTWEGTLPSQMTVDEDNFEHSLVRTLLASVGARLMVHRIGSVPVFELELPPPPERRARPQPVESRLILVGRREDEALQAMLAREGYELAIVDSAEEALACLEGDPPIGGVVTELVLPGMSGLALGDEVVRQKEQLKGRVVLIANTKLPSIPLDLTVLIPPLSRVAVLEGLGKKVRRRR
ncbi:MAG: hybrid sensor histidine kinase/response regulator [Proteobacteria bacterium]|nr:hybrid sensor histidine kinase/response regulator [Pseudomonadota bacterium]